MKAIRIILACIRKADNTYNLINKGDKIVVGLSGGKDSYALFLGLHLYKMFSHTDFEIVPVTLDLGFDNFNAEDIEKFCQNLGYKLVVRDCKDVYKILKLNQKGDKHLPCSICSRMKKAAINNAANEMGFNKVAFAHHADDAVETYFMNSLLGGRIATFSPMMNLEKSKITFIRPLIYVRESDIIKLVKEENIFVGPSICPADKHTQREDIKLLLKELYKKYPMSKKNLLNMLYNEKSLDIWTDKIYLQVNNCGLNIHKVSSPYEMAICLKIRFDVFLNDFNISYNDELELDKEKEATTFLIYLKEKPIGTIRYRFIKEKIIKLERFAILKEYQHQKIGQQVLVFLLDHLYRIYNPVTFTLNSMLYIKNFYKSVGFIETGEIFNEANIPHVKMIYKK